MFDMVHRILNRSRLARFRETLARVNACERDAAALDDARLKESAALFRRRMSHGETLDDLLPEAFARVREAARRQLNQRPFDVQVLGAIAIHHGHIAEMQTGEGKTLTATMPAFLNALTGRGVHVVTVNDYLAQRDADWMGNIHRALGLTVGCIVHGVSDEQRLAAYRADVTYGTNKEFAFDYLRDQIRIHSLRQLRIGGAFEKMRLGGQRVQREHNFAIVDEVDSILIDESRVPLIISNREGEESRFAPAYRAARELALKLVAGQDYTVDEARQQTGLTVMGIDRCRRVKGIETPNKRPFEHLVEQALRAEHFFLRDREYLLVDGRVSIVDEFTGRMMPDRSWSLGLHQAIETKEGLRITEENRTTASITFQRYFKLYRKLAGMTGTASDARREFSKVFHRSVVVIPTHHPCIRKVLPFRLYATWDDKYRALADRIEELHRAGRPVLVGTRSVQRSEAVSRFLTERGIQHDVLNARNHAEEARIIAQAGHRGKVTISTNMAGRGVDIMLGERAVADLGGLHVLGTELHEARRIDLQLAGRSARQGDPGSYEFFLCLEDEILMRWNSRIAAGILRRAARRSDGRVADHWLALLRMAQRGIERRHLRVRVELLKYDERLEEMKGSLGVPLWG